MKRKSLTDKQVIGERKEGNAFTWITDLTPRHVLSSKLCGSAQAVHDGILLPASSLGQSPASNRETIEPGRRKTPLTFNVERLEVTMALLSLT